MATTLEHRHDCAVVVFDGPLTWASTLELLGGLETAVEAYYYSTVELVISSPGGESRALLHLLAALDHWREQGASTSAPVSSSLRRARPRYSSAPVTSELRSRGPPCSSTTCGPSTPVRSAPVTLPICTSPSRRSTRD